MESVFPSRLEEMESFLLDDIGSMIRNEAIERLISPMTVQLCHLIISTEKSDLGSEAFASLEKTAKELALASDEFVQVAKRLARDSEEEWFQVEVGPVADSLITSGRNIMLVAQKLHLQPECQRHREELVTTAQQILLGTTKVLLLEDAAVARTTARAAGRCLTCLDALETAGTRSPRGPWADLASSLLSLGRRGARGPPGRLLRDRVPALLAAARAHPQRRRRLLTLAREALGELLAQLEPGPLAPPAPTRGALPRHLRQLQALLAAPGPERPPGRLDALLASVLRLCMNLAAGAAPPERLCLVARCSRLLELRGLEPGEPGEERAALQAAIEALSSGVRAGLLHQILGTFTDMHSPLQRLVRAASATTSVSSPCTGEAVPKRLQFLFADFQDQATQMLRVAHLVLVCCPRQQTGRDLEATMAGLWGLVVTVQQLFSQGRQGACLDWSPATLQDLLQAWARASERLLACFDGVLYIPEFLSVSIEEMAKHVNLFMWAWRSGDGRGFSGLVTYLQGRATHIIQVMSRYVDQDRDPIFRNGLKVLIWQLDQASLVLGAAADTEACLTAAKHVICAAQSLQEGLDGTNHPDLLSPLRDSVQMFDVANRQPYSLLPRHQDAPALERKPQRPLGLRKSDPGTSYLPRDHLSSPLVPDTYTQIWGPPLPATSKLTLTVESSGHQAVTSAGTNLKERSASVDEAQESLAGEGPLGPEEVTGLREIPTPAPSVTDLAEENAQCTGAAANGLLEMSLQLSERTRDTRQGLVAMAGDWYPLCQQLFCYNPAADLPGSTAVFLELQQNLVSMVQLAARSGPVDLGERDSTGHPEALSQMQGRLEAAETHAKQLLDKVRASDGLHAPRLWEQSFKDRCLLWSVAVRDLLQYMERLSKRQGLFLLSLRQAVKGQQGLQGALAQTAEVSWRLQEATRLSLLLCGDEQVRAELSFLCREVHVLTDALRDVAHALVPSPRPSPSLSTRFQLLCLELTLRAKALTGHLSSINADYGQALQDAFCPRLSVCKEPQTTDPRTPRPESFLQTMVSGIQAVQEMVAGGQGSGPCPAGLPVALENILVLTKEVAQRVPVLREHPEERGMHMLDWLQWEWAAKAHHAVAQLQAWQGDHTTAYRLLAGCLKLSDRQNLTQPQLHCGEGASGVAAADSMDSQDAAPRDTPGSSVGTCTAGLDIPGTTAADLDMHRPCSTPLQPPSCPAWPLAQLDQPLSEDDSADCGDRITQMTRQMAKDVFLMAQSLSSRGHGLTKEELIASARKVATSGQSFARLLHIIAESCTDARCLQELLCALEQVQTTSNQLHIISSVKASLERSKSSEELLVGNAQQVLHAVGKTMRAAEAASLRGLRHPSPDPEELDVAALCMRWRRKLLRHRLRETPNSNSGKLGLRKTSADPAPPRAPGTPVPEAV